MINKITELFSAIFDAEISNVTFTPGFTLSEVLVTLGIIGVVAALTMPVILKGKERKELESGFKRQYSSIQQILLKMYKDNGEVYTRAENRATRQMKGDFTKYFEIVQDCNFQDCSTSADNKSIYRNFINKTQIWQTNIDDGQFITSDGAMILLNDAAHEPLMISFDVNGPKKGPNRWGFDLFTFQLMNDGRLLPVGAEGTMFTDEKYCSKTVNELRNGIACANQAINNLKYFKELP